MAMTQAKLADELKALDPTDSEPSAISNLATAYANFALDAVGNGIPVVPAGVELGKTAMASALTGMSTNGLTAIPTAVIAFWGALCAGFATSFPGSAGATPPPHASLTASFAPLMAANASGGLSKDAAMDALATLLYGEAIIGGIVLLPGTPPVPGPIL